MPRSAKSKRNNGSPRSLQSTTSPAIKNVVSQNVSIVPKRGRPSKNELRSCTENVTEQVSHRKSERRRVARDIFLVFEEQRSTRGSKRSNKKQSKPKFGHLNVEETLKPKGLLRDIKNEPQCFLNNIVVEKTAMKENSKIKFMEKKENPQTVTWSSRMSICSKLNNVELARDVQDPSLITENPIVAKVNPIFLWAKQDDSRIIEVRCEDYDKRNRIRITKTSNGWRAIPRSDPTSSKVVKFYSSSLVKVKRESIINTVANQTSNVSASSFAPENKPPLECSNFDTINVKKVVGLDELSLKAAKNNMVKKSKKHKLKKRKKTFGCNSLLLCTNPTAFDESQLLPGEDVLNCFNNDSYDKNTCFIENLAKVDKNFGDLSFPDSAEDTKNISQNLDVRPETKAQRANSVIFGECEDKSFHDESSFQLCPKTGIFLRKGLDNTTEKGDEDVLHSIDCNSSSFLEIDNGKKSGNSIEDRNRNSIEETHDSLEAKTKNLKDLLDDADLLQHCDDNANSESDLIDCLVKTSCENNLLHENGTNQKQILEHTKNKGMCEAPAGGEDLAQLIACVSEPPKCLSFNEAGEIEALNCELFQSSTYMESFEKQTPTSISDTQLPTHTVSIVQPMLHLEPSMQDNFTPGVDIVNNEDSPKDLSYKKREEVCPPSESRSQCAVTSSSDVIKSPKHDEPSGLASSSETLKNLILEQFIKLNTITNHKQNHSDLDKKTNTNFIYEKNAEIPTNCIETVVIEDDDSLAESVINKEDTEPVQKRMRSNTAPIPNSIESDNIQSKMVMIDKDPDPLTQLRLLIQNSQWKVPDPILVPKDRLSAVLASPAREIPLLITTRPELRLPEAFAYPEIIQNPNILVISMAQLEAILSNDPDINKAKAVGQEFAQNSSTYAKHTPRQGLEYVNDFQVQKSQEKQSQNVEDQHQRDNCSILSNTARSLPKSVGLHHDTSISSEINAATMAVLNQMLWLPYFGQISQDFIKSFKPLNNFTEKMASLLPFCGLKNIESMCEKDTQTQVSSLQQDNVQNTSVHFGSNNAPSRLKQGHSDEMAFYQKMLHHQMNNVLKNNTTKHSSMDRKSNSSNHSCTEKNIHFDEFTNNLLNNKSSSNSSTGLLKSNKSERQPSCSILETGNKAYNLRSSIASRQSSESRNYFSMKRPNPDNKPRVTCKSLLNLLDPEHSQSHNLELNSTTSKNLVSSLETHFQDTNGIKTHVLDAKNSKNLELIKDDKLKSSGAQCNSISSDRTNKQSNKEVNSPQTGTRASEISVPHTETSVPLWHPLFGSNSKSAYSSPWQWTTVTAAGE